MATDITGMPRPLSHWLPQCLTLLALAAYGLFLYRHALNVPLADDIYDVLQVLARWHDNPDPVARWDTLYAQHNDHRTLSSRLVYLGVYGLAGTIDFRTLTLIANLALPGFLLLFYSAAARHPLRWVLLAIASCLLLNIRAYGIILWSMAAFAYFYVLLYGFLAIFMLQRGDSAGFLFGVVFATLSTFSLASGQTTWLIGLAVLLYRRRVCGDPAWFIPGWVVAAAAVLTLWRTGLETPNTLLAMLRHFLDTPGHHILYTLTLLGSAVSEHSVPQAAAAGTLLLAALGFATVRGWRSGDLRLESCAWLVVLSCGAVVLGRGHFTTVDYALSSRYSFPSVLLLATTWMALSLRLSPRALTRVLPFAAVLGITFCIASYRIHGASLAPYLAKRVENFNQDRYPVWGKPLGQSTRVVLHAIDLGIYRPPARPLAVPPLAGAGTPAPDNHSPL